MPRSLSHFEYQFSAGATQAKQKETQVTVEDAEVVPVPVAETWWTKAKSWVKNKFQKTNERIA